ncbi:MAG: cellulase family glycosylhydrolase [Spirochaetales bacterium]|nr:cellulase family glycosylhydrolase [Spirochaetales bacterium]
MKFIYKLILLFILVFTVFSCDINPPLMEFTMVSDVTRPVNTSSGINLGNALEAPNEGEWGVTLQSDYFVKIRSAGFNYLRIPIKWSNHALTSAPYTIDSTFLSRVDWAVANALSNNLIPIINIHHYDEIMTDPVYGRIRCLQQG